MGNGIAKGAPAQTRSESRVKVWADVVGRSPPPPGEQAERGGNAQSLRTQREKEEGAAKPGARMEVGKGVYICSLQRLTPIPGT